jgi:hypothetical protein
MFTWLLKKMYREAFLLHVQGLFSDSLCILWFLTHTLASWNISYRISNNVFIKHVTKLK